MSNGVRIWNASGQLSTDMGWEAGRIIGAASVSYAASEAGTKTATIVGMLTSDILVLSSYTASPFITSSISGTTITVTRIASGVSNALLLAFHAVRKL